MDHETHELVDFVTYVGPGVMFVGSIILRIIGGGVSSPPTSATLILASGVLIVTGVGACLLKLLHYMVRRHACKKRKFRKLIGNYVRSGAKEKRVFKAQMERLDARLRDKRIEQETYERLRTLLEAKHLQQQQEEWAKIEDKVYNPLS